MNMKIKFKCLEVTNIVKKIGIVDSIVNLTIFKES